MYVLEFVFFFLYNNRGIRKFIKKGLCFTMEPIFTSKESKLVVGIGIRTNNKKEVSSDAEIPKQWSRFFTEQISGKIPNSLNSNEILGTYTQYENGVSGNYLMLIGREVSQTDLLPDDLIAITIPEAKYLVFTSEKGAITQIVPDTWKRIWRWFEENDVERTFTGDFEVYDERCSNPEKAIVDIYISIK